MNLRSFGYDYKYSFFIGGPKKIPNAKIGRTKERLDMPQGISSK